MREYNTNTQLSSRVPGTSCKNGRINFVDNRGKYPSQPAMLKSIYNTSSGSDKKISGWNALYGNKAIQRVIAIRKQTAKTASTEAKGAEVEEIKQPANSVSTEVKRENVEETKPGFGNVEQFSIPIATKDYNPADYDIYNKENEDAFYMRMYMELLEKMKNIDTGYLSLIIELMLESELKFPFNDMNGVYDFLTMLKYGDFGLQGINEVKDESDKNKLLNTRVETAKFRSELMKNGLTSHNIQEVQAINLIKSIKLKEPVGDQKTKSVEVLFLTTNKPILLNDIKFKDIEKINWGQQIDLDNQKDGSKIKKMLIMDIGEGAHAEMILLAHIVCNIFKQKEKNNFKGSTIYIAGNKLPCIHCQRMINAFIIANGGSLKIKYIRTQDQEASKEFSKALKDSCVNYKITEDQRDNVTNYRNVFSIFDGFKLEDESIIWFRQMNKLKDLKVDDFSKPNEKSKLHEMIKLGPELLKNLRLFFKYFVIRKQSE